MNGQINNGQPLLKATGLVRHFQVRQSKGLFGKKAVLKAVDDVSFAVNRGETFGLVGESGCGKSTTARLILDIDKPTAGTVDFKDQQISGLPPADRRQLALQMQYVFQDPLGALDPRMRIIDQVAEPLHIHSQASGSVCRDKAADMLLSLDLKDHVFQRYPHELSGGQRQRVVLARALILEPELLICDEPISALDVSIQAQVLNLLTDLRERMRLTIIFISHDMSVVRHTCHQVAVMYLGKIVELAPNDLLFQSAAHPYTQALLSAVPIPQPGLGRKRVLLTGDPPSPIDIPAGCRFHTRCRFAEPLCSEHSPQFKPLREGQWVACHVAHGDT
ncbi:MAG: ATP-binding cassette domain-containing protein [Deltaproteobacteria bacterium]|nr:ATP-binding cassette domain-containing protein [Deltaproteobacteria bacterium]